MEKFRVEDIDTRHPFNIDGEKFSLQDSKSAKQTLMDILGELGASQEDREAFWNDGDYAGDDPDIASCFEQRDIIRLKHVAVWDDTGNVVAAFDIHKKSDGTVTVE